MGAARSHLEGERGNRRGSSSSWAKPTRCPPPHQVHLDGLGVGKLDRSWSCWYRHISNASLQRPEEAEADVGALVKAEAEVGVLVETEAEVGDLVETEAEVGARSCR